MYNIVQVHVSGTSIAAILHSSVKLVFGTHFLALQGWKHSEIAAVGGYPGSRGTVHV